jgi:hypothetical protein
LIFGKTITANMSAAPASGAAAQASKASTTEKKEATKDTKPAAALEEDDEFEDFPVESRCYSHISRNGSGGAKE